MAQELHKYPDVNVFMDAALRVANVWNTMAPLQHFKHFPGLTDKMRTTESAHLALRKLNLDVLAGCVENGTLSAAALFAWLTYDGDLAAALASDPVDDPQQESWVRHALWSSKDARMEDLVTAIEDGLLITTSNQSIIAERKLNDHGLPRQAWALMDALTRGAEVIAIDFSLSQAVASGALNAFRDKAQQLAWDHMADIDPRSSTWAPRDRASSKPTSAQEKRRSPERFGVDGEDLFRMLQIQICQKHLGKRVAFITSDWHAAHAVALTGTARASIYQHGANESGGATVIDLPRARARAPDRSVTVAAPRAGAAVAAFKR